jgi:hypothetical protein
MAMPDRIARGVLSLLLATPGITTYAVGASERKNPPFEKPAKDGAPDRQRAITVPFVLDHNRVFLELDFVNPDGTIRKARAFVDMGDQHFAITESLAHDLHVEHRWLW